jgi:DNA-binding response OmpR family regulator
MATLGSPTRLLLVCDDEQNRTLVRRRFTRIGYQVMEAGDAAKALSLIAMIPFDLAMIDLQEADPCDLLRRVRLSRGHAELPILTVVDRAAGEDGAEALAAGADDCISRPVDLELAFTRAAMLTNAGPEAEDGRLLETNMARLQEAVAMAENTAAMLRHVGHDVRAPLTGVLRAADVLTRICVTPDLRKVVDLVEASSATLYRLLVEALDHPDRRIRTQREVVRVLSADDDAESRFAMCAMLDAAVTPIDLVEVPTGLQAALAAETGTFDLILVNVTTAEAIAGIRAIRRTERQVKTRRIPILAISPDDEAGANALEAGADVYMRRPVSAKGLLIAVTGAINRQTEVLSAVA